MRVTRREFAGALAATALGAVGKIDTHTHFYDPSRPQGVPWPDKGDAVLYRTVLPAEFKKLVRPFGVTGTVVVEASPWVEDNQWVLDLAKDDPFLVGVVGHLEPGKPEFPRNLERFRKNPKFVGIRVGAAAVGDRACDGDFARLADAGLALDVLVPAGALPDVLRLADRIPALRIVINHLPGDPPAPVETIREFRGRSTLYAKVSGVLRRAGGRVPVDAAFYREWLDALWEGFGGARMVYGSNWPVSDKVAPYAAVHGVVAEYFAAKSTEAREQFFRGNARAAYRLAL